MSSSEERQAIIRSRYDELTSSLADPELLSDQKRYVSVVREQAELEPIIQCMNRLEAAQEERDGTEELFFEAGSEDGELRELARQDMNRLDKLIQEETEALQELLVPKDPRDERNVFIEIRGAAGGDESALFAHDLYEMYLAYAAKCGFEVEVLDASETEIGGMKEVTIRVSGRGAFSKFKYEMGVHRVQRVPVTESQGRIHTSTATVAVMPEVDEVDIEIDPNDLRIDTYRASGAGGQHVNKTSSAIRITHLPTGIVVTCQDERSQHKNREKAMAALRSRLYQEAEESRSEAIADERRSQVGTGDRSERIRTYNFHQGRVTDHRIGLTLYKLPDIMAGDMDELVEALQQAERAESVRRDQQNEVAGA